MSKYFVTSQTTQTYPYTFADLRARPPQRRRTGFLLAGVALASAIFGGAAAYAFMATGDEPAPVQVAQLDTVRTDASDEIAVARITEPTRAEKVEAEKAGKAETAGVEARMADPAPLAKNNPRWADEAPEPVIAADDNRAVNALETAFNGKRDDVVDANVDGDASSTLVAALSDVDVAETEADVLALEKEMNPDVATSSIEQAEEIRPARISAPSFATGDLTSARATKWVNMRASNNKHAAKMLVVPQDAEILADPACQHWCRVVYDGRLGYIYRTYIRFPGEATVARRTTQVVETREETKSEAGLLKTLIRGGNNAGR
ncbi:MAG: hypothetical protein R3D45_13015 [Rhizobiaceae bacterium]